MRSEESHCSEWREGPSREKDQDTDVNGLNVLEGWVERRSVPLVSSE